MSARQFFSVSVHRRSGGAKAEVVLVAKRAMIIRIDTQATPGKITEAEIE